MKAADVVAVGLSGVRSRRLRSALAAAGVAIGIASMVGVLGISSSSRAELLAELDRLGTDLLRVAAGQTLLGEDASLPAQSTGMAERIGPVRSASATAPVDASVYRNDRIPDGETGGISVRAADVDLVETLRGRVRVGAFLNPATARYPAVVLGSVAAERLGVDRADGTIAVWLGDRWFTVVGILDPLPLAPEINRSALVGFAAAEDLLGHDGSPATIYVRTGPGAVDTVRTVLAATVNPRNPEEVEVSRPSDALAARAAADTAFTALLLGLGGVALFVGGVGIANQMVVSVLERRPEIGLRRALGASRGDVRAQFLAESVVLAGLGGVGGVGLGALVTAAYAAARGWPVSVPVAAVGGGIVAAVLVGGLAGLWPAMRAAALSPTDALRST